MSTKALNRLTEKLEEAESKISKLEQEKENREYAERWRWRHIRTLSDEDNLDLPVPRLEIRYSRADDYNSEALYSLVYRHLLGQIELIPIGLTRVGDSGKYARDLDEPFRDGAHIKNEMKQLGLRGFVVGNGKYKEINNA
jgi:hypothetical protein